VKERSGGDEEREREEINGFADIDFCCKKKAQK